MLKYASIDLNNPFNDNGFANSFPVKSFWAGKPYKYGVQAINRMDPRSMLASFEPKHFLKVLRKSTLKSMEIISTLYQA